MVDIETENTSEALKCLENYINNIIFSKDLINQKQQLLTNITVIKQALLKSEKEHKVLEIIKEKNVWIAKLKSLFKRYNNDLDVLRLYNANTYKIDYQLTQEQFDLLKEVLK